MPLLAKNPLLDWLYPPSCALCRGPLRRGQNICFDCAEALPPLPNNSCLTCGQSFDGNLEAPANCPNCLALKPTFNFATAALKSNEDSLQLIHQFKLLKHPELGHDLAGLAAKAFRREPRLSALNTPLLIPVPLHGGRLRSRRFNQASLLSQFLAKELDLSQIDALKRIRPTQRQATLTRKQRLRNLRKAFRLKIEPERLTGQDIILIDDVFTTGSTAQECARILRTAKPATIAVFTVVRA